MIEVDTPSGLTANEADDGYCDVLEAVTAAAFGRSFAECRNPNGVARVALRPGSTYPVRRTLRLAGRTEIGIPDGTAGTATIAAAAGFDVDDRDESTRCLVFVSDGTPQVGLRDVTLTQDPIETLAGACVARGTLDLRRVRVSGFRASGVVATCLPASGCDHETDFEDATTVRVLGSVIEGNRSAGKGAGIFSEGSGATVLVANSAIVGNASDGDGGGLYLGGGWATNIIQSSTISGNTTSSAGAGLFVRFAEATNTYVHVVSSTIAGNTAGGTGGGIEFQPAEVGVQDVSLFSSIVAGNFSPSTLEWNINAGWSANPAAIFHCVERSLVYVLPGHPRPADSDSCIFDVRNPFLGPLAPLGGEGDRPLHPLLAGSPAVDASPGHTPIDDQRDSWIRDVDPATAEWTMFGPLVDGDGDGVRVRDLGAYERNDRWQTELLAVRAKGPAAHTVVTIPSGYDRGAGTAYGAAGVRDELVTYAVPVGEAGRYDLVIGARKDADAGTFAVAVADGPAGPWTTLGEQDGYQATSAFFRLGPFPARFTVPGEKLVRFTVTGKSPGSAGYGIYLDFIEMKRRMVACPVAAVAAGGVHTCALMGGGGGVRCWGENGQGQLGDGGSDRALPPAVDVVAGVAAVATGGAHTCVLASGGGGGVRCWGGNGNGQLGDGSTTTRTTPPLEPVLSGVKAIAAGRTHTCALMTGGGVRCWGANGSGQLGDGTMTDRSSPPAADVGADIAALSAGDIHTCALTSAGGARCWGHNLNAELGIGSYDTILSPPSADTLTGVEQIVASNLFTCALMRGGGVRCWGYNATGAIGDETEIAVDRLSPAATDILGGVASLTAGLTHVCARMTGGGVRCWGGNESGQLGDGMGPIFALTPPPMDGPGLAGTCE